MNDMHAVQGGNTHAPQGGELVPVRTPGASYLVRTEDGDGKHLEFFGADEKNGIAAQYPLCDYLASLIQVGTYAIGPAVTRIRRWDDDDSLHDMFLSMVSVRQEAEDIQDQEWLLEEKGNPLANITFTVEIDPRGQQ